MAYNYEDKLIETIKYIADSAVAAAPYDKTVRATILSCDDESIAKYKVRYQDAIFFAYGSTADVRFSPGSEVYVLIPNNDSTREKTILGSTEKLGTNYVSIISNDILYIPIGSNAVETNKGYDLSSYISEEKEIYNINSSDSKNLIINNDILKKVLVDTAYIRLGARFTTSIPQEQQGGTGNYGIKFTLKFLKNDGSLERGEGDINCKTIDYIININDMSNDPYLLNDFLQNKEFEIDGKNFVEVEKISIFSQDFPYQDPSSQIRDIHIEDFQIVAIKKIDEASTGGAWMVITAPEGPYFDSTHDLDSSKKLETTIYVDGKIVNPNSQKVNYYWFVEDVRVNSNWKDNDFYKKNYCNYGGQGWRCLNRYNIIKGEQENDPEIVEWVSGDSFLIIRKHDVISKELRYKCVAVYNNLVLKYEILVHNYNSNYDVKVESSAGDLFYFDSGTTNLTCTVVNPPVGEITYVWGMTDYLGDEHYFENTTLQGGIINGNQIESLPIYEITKYSTYKCSAFLGDNLLGIGSITLTNSMEQGGQYNLIIKNGSQIYKYNENGVAPNESTDGEPFVIKPLEFVLYDSLGKEIDHEFLNNDFYWILPMSNTLLEFGEYQEETYYDEEAGEYYKRIKGQEQITYKIAKKYNYNYTNNIVRLEVNYQGAVFIANSNFSFIKEGEDGTNGTDYYCRIVPNYSTDLSYPIVAVRKTNQNLPAFYCNGQILNSNYVLSNFLKAQLWENGDKIPEDNYTVKWEVLENGYCKRSGIQYSDKSYIGYVNSSWVRLDNKTPQGTTGSKQYKLWEATSLSPSLVIKATVEYNKLYYYATYPLIWITTSSSGMNYIYNVKNGFRYVTYAADGMRPQYNNADPFEIIVKNAQGVDITNNFNYNWDVYGYLYQKAESSNTWTWVKQSPFKSYEVKDENQQVIKNKCRVSPPDSYDGHCTNFIVQCTIKDGSTEIGLVQIPIHLMLNKYNHAALNGWDGNSISIDANGNGAILAPQIGAGKKDPNNGFTGVLMGTVKEANHSTYYTGIHAYSNGERTIFMNAKNGSAIFGKRDINKNSGGQIIIDPNGEKALLYSSNYYDNYKEDGLPSSYSKPSETYKKDGQIYYHQGMLIDLTTPQIRFRSGKFEVNSEGHLIAKGGGSIAGWEIGNTTLKSYNNNVVLNSGATKDSDIVFKAGSRFSVTADGTLTAKNGNFTGNITGGTISIGNNFKVTSSGTVTAKNGTFTGTIEADDGKIGGWTINSNSLFGGQTTLYSSGKITVGSNFSVDANGYLNAINGEFSGTITGSDIYGAKFYESAGGTYIKMYSDSLGGGLGLYYGTDRTPVFRINYETGNWGLYARDEIFLWGIGNTVMASGDWNFGNADVSGLDTYAKFK